MEYFTKDIDKCAIKECCADEEKEAMCCIEKGEINKACAFLCYLSYMYLTQKLLKTTILHDIVYGFLETKTTVFIVFKGTSRFNEVITDIKFFKTDDEFGIPGRIHRGFYDTLKDDIPVLVHKIKTILDGRKLILTGHSLGGALACILHAYIQKKEPELDSELITLGAPRVGDKPFAKFLSTTKASRIVNRGDIVTMIPTINYYHHYKEIAIGTRFTIPGASKHSILKYIQNL
jgi:hypothetical protein